MRRAPVVDPVTLAVVQGALQQVAEEMDSTLVRAALSPVISEGHDRADGIYSAVDGSVIAQGKSGIPILVGVMQYTVEHIIRWLGTRKPVPGDVYLVNDPYYGGTHLMDVRLAKPYFYRGKLFAYLATSGHWLDMGGMVPGGFATRATEMYQEGLRIPPVKLYAGGRVNEEVVAILMGNLRTPRQAYGDLEAHLSALRVGEEGLTRLLDKYGVTMVRRCVDELEKRSAQLMRSFLKEVPEGSYNYREYLDSDGVVDEPLSIHLDMTVKDGRVHFDFSQSSPPCKGPLNSVLSTTQAAVFIAVRHLFPDLPINAGCFRPFSFNIPPTTFLNAAFPRPVSGCGAEVSQRLVDVVLGAFSQAIPDRVPATAFGTVNNFTAAFEIPGGGTSIMYLFNGGGYGGSRESDGLTYACPTTSIARVQEIEVLERVYPIRFLRFAIREGSAGAGRQRGGFGAVLEVEMLNDARASFLGDRGKFPPRGFHGGLPAMECRVEVLDDKRVVYAPAHVTKDQDVPVRRGQRIRLSTPGGGGYGKPYERSAEAVARDVARGYIAGDFAERVHGVILNDTGGVDRERTQGARSPAARRTSRKDPGERK